MRNLRLKFLVLCALAVPLTQQTGAQYYVNLDDNPIINSIDTADDLDLHNVNWQQVIPLLLQREELRLCLAIYRYNESAPQGTYCMDLLARTMGYCDIGHIEDISMTLRDAFGSMLFDSMQKCRPGLELFGLRCRQRA